MGAGKAVLFLRTYMKLHLHAHRHNVWDCDGTGRSVLASSTRSGAPVIQCQIAGPVRDVGKSGEHRGPLSG
jgi:hypothetical protein